MALILDIKANRWRAIVRFTELLHDSLADNLVSIIAPPDSPIFYDSNVLVVDKLDRAISLKVAEAALKVNEQYKAQ